MQPILKLYKMENNTHFVFYSLILITQFQLVLHVSALCSVENRAETCSINLNVIIETELGKAECIFQLNFDNSVLIGTTRFGHISGRK